MDSLRTTQVPHYLWVDVMEVADVDTDNKIYVKVEICGREEVTDKTKTADHNSHVWDRCVAGERSSVYGTKSFLP